VERLHKSRKMNYKERACSFCGKMYKPYNFTQKYCSRACNMKAQIRRASLASKKERIKKCAFCGEEFSPYSSIDKFCSANCRIENVKSKRSRRWTKEQVEKRKGGNNPSYRTGYYCGEKIGTRNTGKRACSKYREKIKNERGYLYCEKCGTTNSLRFECHHLVYRSEQPKHKNIHHEDNLVILCIKCHNALHSKKSDREFLLNKKGTKKLFPDIFPSN